MQEAITWICVDQDIRRYIAWLSHNKLRPKADVHSKPTPVTIQNTYSAVINMYNLDNYLHLHW